MAKKRPQRRTPPPATPYPASPHVVGIDWIELRVRRPAASAVLYQALGFEYRGQANGGPMVALAGVVLVFRRVSRSPVEKIGPTLLIQVAVDDLPAMRRRILGLGLQAGPVRRQPRGDISFLFTDSNGNAIRFVAPDR